MSANPPSNAARRKAIRLSATVAGGAALATLAPFVGQALLHRKTTDSGEIVEVDLSPLASGQLLTVDWLGAAVWIVRRSPEMIGQLAGTPAAELADPASEHSRQPAYARNPQRSLRPEFFVSFAMCTHLACTPIARFRPGSAEGMPDSWPGGFICPCHSSLFDLAGRVYKNREAKQNLAIPPHRFVSEHLLRIGEDPADAG